MLGRLRIQLARALASAVRLGSASAGAADRAVGRVALGVKTLAPVPVLVGVGIGVAVWTHRNAARFAKYDTNKLAEPERLGMLKGVGAAIAGVCLLYFLVMLARRIRTGSFRALDTAGRLNRWLTPFVALPLIATLRLPNIERDSPKLTLFLVALATAIAGYGVYAWGKDPRPASGASLGAAEGEPEPKRPFAGWKYLAGVAVAALWAGYGLFFSRLAITNHHALNTRTTDLGYYDNIFYQSIHGRWLACTFIKASYHGSAHFDPILVLLSPLYLIHPRAELLLVLQSVWLGAGVVPVYLLAQHKLGSRVKALLLAAAWAAYPAMHGANLYEFHSLTLVAPILVWVLYFYETGAARGYWLAVAVALLCREDIALLMAFVGFAALLDPRPGKARTGWLTILVSAVYFSVVKRYFMTSSDVFMTGNDSYSFAYYYDELMPDKGGVKSILTSLLTNPTFALKLMLEEPKIVFIIQLMMPLAFLPLLAKPGRWMLLYGALFCLLASRDAVFSIHFQYSAVIFPIAFALTPIALRRAEESARAASAGLDSRRLSRALLGAVVVGSALVSWKFGAISDNASFRGGFVRVARTLTPQQQTTYAWIREQVDKIPPSASVAATNRLGAHISNRKGAFFYSASTARTVDYAFIDENEIKGNDLERHKTAVTRGELVELGRMGKMALFQRNAAVKPAPPSPPPAKTIGSPEQARDAGAPPVKAKPKVPTPVTGPTAPPEMEEPDEDPAPGP